MEMKRSGKTFKRLTAAILSCALLAACAGCTPTNPPEGSGSGTPGTPGTPGGLSYYQETTVSAAGTNSGFPEEGGKFYSDYVTLDDAHEAGMYLNIRLAEEGIVLLKNENNALPLTRDECNVTLLGIKSIDIQTGGGGSGNGYVGSSANEAENSYKIDPTSLEQSMTDAGFHLNEKVLQLYRDNIANMSYEEFSESSGSSQTLTRELPMSYYSDMITRTYKAYDDAAIITFSRSGAEGLDEIAHADSHVLQLTQEEQALVKHAKEHFDKVIVLVNTGNVIELGELNAPKTADNLGVDAILYIGHLGNNGAAAVGEILNGTVNPSGHTVDLWSADITKDPSYTNFGDMSQNGAGYDNYIYNGDTRTNYHSVEYREDIYIGYRYYETVAADMNANEAGSGDTWYSENVVYPFGHGLSYTTFSWELTEDIAPTAVISTANSTVTLKVKVTNTGDMTGKDVVQVYAKQPYTPGGIEKAERVLVAYGKTGLLKPGQSEVLTLQFVAQDMASFDWSDKNSNGFQGYELEAGSYEIIAARDSHTPVLSVTRTIETGIQCKTDLYTGNEITAVFSQTDGDYADYNTTNESLLDHLISRENGLTQPAPATQSDRTVNQAWVDMMESYDSFHPSSDDAGSPLWNVSSAPSTWTQSAGHSEDYSDAPLKISDMSGVDYQLLKVDNGAVVQGTDEGSQKWEQFMNQFTWEELCQLATQGAYGRPSVASVNMPFQLDIDGPCQIAWYGNRQADNYYGAVSAEEKAQIAQTANGMGTFWVGAVLIASTWNNDLAEKQGVMVGNESILTNSPGWYGPACNTHRSALGGRNFEYYSEDPVIAGGIVSAVIRGATSKGTVCYLKHMFLNDQETDRGGICTYATEQAIREIYLKPYEIALKSGRSLGTMGGGNRIGNRRVYDSYALYNGILRDEWNFKGLNITDSVCGGSHPDMDMLLRAGINCPLGQGSMTASRPVENQNDLEAGAWDAGANTVVIDGAPSPTQWYVVRVAAMHNLYATANSNGIDNGPYLIPEQTFSFAGLEQIEPQPILDLTTVGMAGMSSAAAEGLPAGLSVTAAGVLSGTPVEAGEFNVTVSAKADGWAPVSFPVRMTVSGVLDFDAAANTVSCDLYKVGDVSEGTMMGMPASREVTQIEYLGVDLPEGVSVNGETGRISGPAGSTVTVKYVVTIHSMLWGVYDAGNSTVEFTQTFTLS